ncbi:MAG: glucokinase [Maricaulaceae bacterium]
MSNRTVLVGDVGGTNCRFGLARWDAQAGIELSQISKLKVAEYSDFYAALTHYLSTLDAQPKQAAFALAGPKFNGEIRMTNLQWVVAEDELRSRFGFDVATLANDFTAMARGAVLMADEAFQTIIAGKVNYSLPVAVLGPGTGLGVAGVLPGQPPRILPTEGGYSAFAPQDDMELEILKILRCEFDFVAAEHLLSGPGLHRLYKALGKIKQAGTPLETPSDIVTQAHADETSLSAQVMTIFCNILGGFSGNTAHTLGASGGIVIAGGVGRHIAPFIAASDFEARFKNRGKAAWFTQNIPVRLLTAHSVALYGGAALLADG